VTARVVYWNNTPSPYMVEHFNAVARRGNISFEAWFSTRITSGRGWAVNESTVTFESWVRRRRWKEAVKSIVLLRADAILTAGSDGSDYVKRYGVAEEADLHRPFT
jgi:hypothetical protein